MTEPKLNMPSKASPVFVFSQLFPSLLLLIFTVFGLFVGLRFLSFIDKAESHRTTLSAQWSETGFEQLKQMNATIKLELDLILDQRRENSLLQAKIQEITQANTLVKNTNENTLPSLVQGWK